MDPPLAYIGTPYVNPSQAQARQAIFVGCDPVSAQYAKVGQGRVDETLLGAFFQQCHAKGPVVLKPIRRSTRNSNEVEQFLAKQVDLSGTRSVTLSGYEWADDILQFVKKASNGPLLCAWLGQEVLPSHCCRFATAVLAQGGHPIGSRGAAWWLDLEEWHWIPCQDGKCRRPSQVLWTPDAAHPGIAPTASLEPSIHQNIAGLNLAFGGNVPDAPAIHRLSIHGPKMDIVTLAVTLDEAVTEADQNEVNAALLLQALANPLFPIIGGATRLPVERMVHAQAASRRPAVALTDSSREPSRWTPLFIRPLNVSGTAHRSPITTTGLQALAYLQSVWTRAATGEDGLANQERQHLPLAYRYLLEDMDGVQALSEAWHSVRENVFVFGDRRWVRTEDPRLWFDDTFDGRLRAHMPDAVWATGGHFGDLSEQQSAVARLLGVKVLSDHVTRTIEYTLVEARPEWGTPLPSPPTIVRTRARI